MIHISSRDNPAVKAIRKLAQESSAYRKQGQYWVEGDHLCRAALLKGVHAAQVVICESLWQEQGEQWASAGEQVLVMPDALFAGLSGLDSPGKVGFVVNWAGPGAIIPGMPSVVLDRLQDAGNVGAILRCAAAFGFRQVITLQGTAALWSHKVLRAGMGAHWGMQLVEGAGPEDLDGLQLPLVTTSSHEGPFLHEMLRQGQLPKLCGWVMGHEGQGVSQALMDKAFAKVRIAQPGGEESLNVATAAAICLHASATAFL
jgi:TrmH family RNA methyltransferase